MTKSHAIMEIRKDSLSDTDVGRGFNTRDSEYYDEAAASYSKKLRLLPVTSVARILQSLEKSGLLSTPASARLITEQLKKW